MEHLKLIINNKEHYFFSDLVYLVVNGVFCEVKSNQIILPN